MAIVLTFIGSTPGQTQFGLDSFTERYKCQNDDGSQIAAADVLTDDSLPQMGSAHPTYTFMFVTSRHCDESGEKASALDLVYMGCIQTTGDESPAPVLPAQKPSYGGQVASATSNTSSIIWPLTTANPMTVTFYAITNTLSFISNDIADASEPDDPPEVTSLITWDLGFGAEPGGTIPGYETLFLTEAFVQSITEAPPDIEPLVASQFYQITKRKTRTLLPYAPPS